MNELIGKTIDNYKFVSILGEGGMGIVYKAYDIKLERYVAIKLLNSRLFQKEESIARFKKEAKNQAKLSHPNIVAVYGFIEYSNFLGIVMEYVEGESLEHILERMKTLHPWDAIYILKQILTAIGYAHIKGFIHRDVKPSNIIINGDGIVKIMDFGISKSLFDKGTTRTGAKLGTLYYMSPEQVKGEEVTHHADIYSIGCTFYEMLMGTPPFDSENDFDIMEMHLKKDPPSVGTKITQLTEETDRIILKAMNKLPANRYDNCEEFLFDINDLEKSVKERHSDLFSGVKKSSLKKSTTYAVVLTAFILFCGLVYLAYRQVDQMIKSKQLDSFNKYSITQLFKADSSFYTFENIVKQNSNTKLNLNSISFLPNKSGVIVGDSGLVMCTQDGGNNWVRVNTGIKTTLFDCAQINGGKIFVVGDSSTVLVSSDNFSDFQKVPIEQGYSFLKIFFIDGNTGFILGSKGVIFKTYNGGATWRKVSINLTPYLFDIHFCDSYNGYAVGWDGVILSTQDGGENWQKIEIENKEYLKSIDFLNKTLGIAVGGNGTILRTADGGKKWSSIDANKQVIYEKIKIVKEDFVLLAGKKGTILVSKDQGLTWTQIRVNFYYDITNFVVTNDNDLYIIGVSGSIFKISLIQKENKNG